MRLSDLPSALCFEPLEALSDCLSCTCILCLHLLNFSNELVISSCLIYMQLSGISMHAVCHVIWEVMECKLGLLLCSSDKGHCIGREGSEAWKCEWCKLEGGQCG